MILYLGASSLIKLYFKEPNSDMIRHWASTAEMLATCKIAFAEIMSAVDQRFKGGDLSKKDYDTFLRQFSQDWDHFVKLDFNDIEAALLVKKYGLTRFGAVHLSAANLIRKEHQRLLSSLKKLYGDQGTISLFFASSDESLRKAAASEGLAVLPSG